MRLTQDELIRTLRGQARERDGLSAKALAEEAADLGQVTLCRARLDTALVQQEALVGLCDPLNRVAAISTGMWGWDPPGGSQQVQQLAAGHRIAESSLLRLANGMECHDLIVVEIIDSQLLRRELTAHISSQMQFLPSRRGCVTFGCEPDSECVDIVG